MKKIASLLDPLLEGVAWQRTPCQQQQGGSSPSPPATPDYPGAAAATAQGNLENTRAAAAANRVNQQTPFGNLTYSQTPTYTTDADSYNSALAAWNANGQQGAKPDVSGYQKLNPDAGWNATMSLTPQEQGLLNTYLGTQGGLSQLQGNVLGQVGNTIGQPFQNSGAPALQGSVSQGSQVPGQPAPGTQHSDALAQINPDGTVAAPAQSPTSTGIVAAPNLSGIGGTANGIDTSTGLPVADPAYQQKYQDAVYKQQSQYLDPQWQQQQDQFNAQMANQGLVPGDEAYNKAYTNFANARQNAYSNAGLNAITGGLNAENTMFNQGLNSYNSRVGAEATSAGIQNQAQAQNYGEALANAGFQNNAQNQWFGQGLANANLANQANQQAFTQNAYKYNLPLNTLNAVMSGSQITSPQFQNVPQQQTTPGADYLGAANMGYQGNLNAYNAQVGNQSNFMNGLMGLGGSALTAGAMFMSDHRLKKNIQLIGKTPSGHNLYAYEYIWGEPSIGVMADEVRYTGAVHRIGGYDMVDYGKIS
jgi:hypothetical protein